MTPTKNSKISLLNEEAWEKLKSLKNPVSYEKSQIFPQKKSHLIKNKVSKSLDNMDGPQTQPKNWVDRKKDFEKTIQSLEKKFPQCFSLRNPQPLKVNILYDLYEQLAHHEDEISKSKLRGALKFYTRSTFYLNSLVNSTHRINLNGELVEMITQDHKDFTLTLLNNRNARKEKLG